MTYTLHFVEAGTASPGLALSEALEIGHAYGTKYYITDSLQQVVFDSECVGCYSGTHRHGGSPPTDSEIDAESMAMREGRLGRILDDEMDLH